MAPLLSTIDTSSIGVIIAFSLYFTYGLFRIKGSSANRGILKKGKTLQKLKKLTWEEFEILCVEVFRAQGWKATGNSIKGSDGGIDIRIKKRSIKGFVQCKRYKDARVGVKVLREMYGLLSEHGDNKRDYVYIVTSNVFTRECYKYINKKNIVLINGEELVDLVRKLLK
ncbi:MAG: restriction endonuclease [Epsilonproteobacteria bacterium]|nr:restriction endonuclease [Campylobacterota bacterium]